MEMDEERKARLEKMVATTQLRLALETKEVRRSRLKHLSDNPIYIHSNSPNPGALGLGTAHNLEMSVLAGVLGHSPVIKLQLPPAAALVKLPQLQLPAGLQGKARGKSSS